MSFPPRCDLQLPGWGLFWAEMVATGEGSEALAQLRREVAQRARDSHRLEELPDHPTVAAVRKLFRQAGCDPTRWRPSSEALARRVLKGEELPAISPLVDINNCLSLELLVPACVMAAGTMRGKVTLRAGKPGETMLSLRGPVGLEGKPLLADEEGPFGTPITDSQRVKLTPETQEAWLVVYLPMGVVEENCVRSALDFLLNQAPVARVVASAFTG
ncbi:MAG: phenylalanine--tRNA ligase beta subunit-related protein [Acidobacteriota bacterium]|uniref:B3/B4 tRNA-binding domain-containing protein n=1 Tax=Thermoanaerobaculum aquaticum TaxID=1312852 RepID=A0A7C2NGK7_9BACT